MPESDKSYDVAAKVSNTMELTSLWRLFHKKGMNPRAELIFPFKGDRDSAIKRGREYCLRMNYKFIHVEPFLVDLDLSEKEFSSSRV